MLKIGLVVMVVLNAFLAYLLVAKPTLPLKKERPQSELFQRISEELMLTPGQRTKYEELAKEHREQMKTLEGKQSSLVKSYFETLMDDAESSEIRDNILNLEKQKLEVTYSHFSELKNLLDSSQKKNFELVIEDMLQVLIRQSNTPPPPNRGNDRLPPIER